MSLEVKDLVAGYGKLEILHGVSISAEKSKITCLIGPNGAGKSTLLHAVCGFIRPWSGKVFLDGEDVTGLSTEALLKKGVCYLTQKRSVFSDMTVYENLRMGGWIIRGDKERLKDAIEEVYNRFPVLKERKNVKAGLLSGGEQRMLEIARAMMTNPRVLLADELSLGLGPKIQANLFNEIRKISSEGKTVLIVEQKVRDVLRLSDQAFILDLGRNCFKGDPKSCLEDERLVNLYMGMARASR